MRLNRTGIGTIGNIGGNDGNRAIDDKVFAKLFFVFGDKETNFYCYSSNEQTFRQWIPWMPVNTSLNKRLHFGLGYLMDCKLIYYWIISN